MNGKEYWKYCNEYYKTRIERRYDSYEDALEDGIFEALEML